MSGLYTGRHRRAGCVHVATGYRQPWRSARRRPAACGASLRPPGCLRLPCHGRGALEHPHLRPGPCRRTRRAAIRSSGCPDRAAGRGPTADGGSTARRRSPRARPRCGHRLCRVRSAERRRTGDDDTAGARPAWPLPARAVRKSAVPIKAPPVRARSLESHSLRMPSRSRRTVVVGAAAASTVKPTTACRAAPVAQRGEAGRQAGEEVGPGVVQRAGLRHRRRFEGCRVSGGGQVPAASSGRAELSRRLADPELPDPVQHREIALQPYGESSVVHEGRCLA